MMETFLLFFVSINFQLSAKHSSVLPYYFNWLTDMLDKGDITSVNVKTGEDLL